MVEVNPFRNFIPPKPDKLIVGSFPCFNGKDYGDWFYSGSGKNHFWMLLSDCFGMPSGTLEEKVRLCTRHHIALADVAYKIERKKNNCSDSNLVIVEFNHEGIEACLKCNLKTIFFTSRFVEKHFLKHYPATGLETLVLVSPSPAANMHIGGLKEFKELISSGRINSPYQYRLLKYKEVLGNKI